MTRIAITFLLLIVACPAVLRAADENAKSVEANRVAEISLTSNGSHADPFNDVELDVTFTSPSGRKSTVPAFWAGGKTWRVRYSSPETGTHRYQSACTDTKDSGLHGAAGAIEVQPYRGDNALYKHGPLKVAADRRHFQHADGTPFFWLGDTWWMGLCDRLHFPDDVATLAKNRRQKGFNVIQIVAGLYPDMGAFDERGRNEAGFPWEKDYSRIRPEYFNAADRRLSYLADQGFVPCIVMAWGYHLPWLGPEKMKQHVRYVIARYGALPVVWCMAGEVNLPYYLEKGFPLGGEKQTAGWEDIIRYAHKINGQDRLISVHPTGIPPLSGRPLYSDQNLLHFDMLQTGHGHREVLAPTINALRASYAAEPTMPVLNSEVTYEALSGAIPAEIPRLMFWTNMLSGAAGHTYGGNGIWQVNRRDQPYGNSPHGGTYGPIPWDESMNLPGSGQIGSAKRLLEEFNWQRFEPHPEWAAWAGDASTAVKWGDWIWYPEGDPTKDAPEEIRYLRKSFEIAAGKPIKQARLSIAVDDKFTAYLNGKELGSAADWMAGRTFSNIASSLQTGRNILAIRGENAPGPKGRNPAGLSCGLEIEFADGTRQAILSNDSWRSAKTETANWHTVDFDDKSWQAAKIVATYGAGPWGSRSTTPDAFLVPYTAGIPDGLRVVYAPSPRPVNLQKLKPREQYTLRHFDPVAGTLGESHAISANANGSVTIESPADIDHDWVLIIQPQK